MPSKPIKTGLGILLWALAGAWLRVLVAIPWALSSAPLMWWRGWAARWRFSWGPDYARCLQRRLFVGFLVRDWEERASPGRLLSCVWAVSLSWNWLPTLYRLPANYPSGSVHAINAYGWTGRYWHLVGVAWPMVAEIQIGRWRWSGGLGELWRAR